MITSVLLLLNLGLYQFLKPGVRLVSQLPYILSDLEHWDLIRGEWSWENGILTQQSSEPAWIVSPLRIEPEGLRAVTRLEEGAGLSFSMRYPHKLSESHYLMIRDGILEAGYITSDDWIVQAQLALETGSVHEVQLRLEPEYFSLSVQNQELAALPLMFRGSSLALFSVSPTRIHGLLVDREMHVTQ